MHWVAHKISSKQQLRLFRAKERAKTILTIELLKIGRLKADHVRSKAKGHRHRPLDEAACIRDFAKTHAWRRVVDAPVPAVTAFSHCFKDMIRVALGALENKKCGCIGDHIEMKLQSRRNTASVPFLSWRLVGNGKTQLEAYGGESNGKIHGR